MTEMTGGRMQEAAMSTELKEVKLWASGKSEIVDMLCMGFEERHDRGILANASKSKGKEHRFR